MVRTLCRLAARVPGLIGSPWTFLGCVAVAALWLASGPIFDFSDGWVLWPATITSVGAFLLVVLLQYTQNRDTRAIQLKLDELIRGMTEARTELVRLEKLSDQELDVIEEEFLELREQARER